MSSVYFDSTDTTDTTEVLKDANVRAVLGDKTNFDVGRAKDIHVANAPTDSCVNDDGVKDSNENADDELKRLLGAADRVPVVRSLPDPSRLYRKGSPAIEPAGDLCIMQPLVPDDIDGRIEDFIRTGRSKSNLAWVVKATYNDDS